MSVQPLSNVHAVRVVVRNGTSRASSECDQPDIRAVVATGIIRQHISSVRIDINFYPIACLHVGDRFIVEDDTGSNHSAVRC